MGKFVIFLTMVIGLISGAVILSSQYSYAQQTTAPINFTKFFSENKEVQNCYTMTGVPECFPAIDVLYEDQSTVALKSRYVDAIWKGVAEVKKYGYKIDGITSFPISNSYSGGDTTVNILVVMSK